MTSRTFGVSKEVLYDSIYKAIPVTVDADEVDAENGKKILPAGTLLKGANNSVFDNREEKVVVANIDDLEGEDAEGFVDGVLLYDVDVTDGDAPASLVYNGTVWAQKVLPEVNDAVKEELPQIKFVQE